MSTSKLTDAARAMFAETMIASFTTVNADGSLQMTPTWIDLDGDVVVINTMSARSARPATSLRVRTSR